MWVHVLVDGIIIRPVPWHGADHWMLEKQVTSMGEDFSPNMATQVWKIWFFISIAAMLEVVFHNTIRWLKESTYHSWKPCSCCFMFLILTVFLCFFRTYVLTCLLPHTYTYTSTYYFYLCTKDQKVNPVSPNLQDLDAILGELGIDVPQESYPGRI